MHQVHLQLNDRLYDQAKRRATEAGFKTVDEFIANILSDELIENPDNVDHLFTPERLAMIDKAAAQIKEGKCMTAKQADAELARRRAEWLENNPG